MSAAVMRKPSQQEMLKQLGEAVDIQHSSQEAQQAHARLKASIWTDEDQAKGRELGRDAQRRAANLRRTEWKEWAIRAILDNYDCGQYLSRQGVLENLYTDADAFGHKGKRGCGIDKRTIAMWFSKEREAEIRMAAIHRIIERELKRHGIDRRNTQG